MGAGCRWSGLVLLLALAGCSGRIWEENATAAGIRLHWYTQENTIDNVRAEAVEHCRSFGRRAELIQEFEDQDMSTADFACLPGAS